MDKFHIIGDKKYQKIESMLDTNHDTFLFSNTSLENLIYCNVNVIWNIANAPINIRQLIPFDKYASIMIYHGEDASDLPITIVNLGERYETYRFKNGAEVFVAYQSSP